MSCKFTTTKDHLKTISLILVEKILVMLNIAVVYFEKYCTCFLIVVTEGLIRSKEKLAFFFLGFSNWQRVFRSFKERFLSFPLVLPRRA